MTNPKFYSSLPFVRLRCKLWVVVSLLVFSAIFIFSTLSYWLNSNFKSYTLLFPSAQSEYSRHGFSDLYAEHRKIPVPQVLPSEWSQEERQIYYLTKELFYGPGPGMIYSYPFVPPDSQVSSLAMQGRDLYIDFNDSLLKGKSEHHFDIDAILALIEKVLRLNFPKLKGIYFSIDSLPLSQFLQQQEEAPKAPL